MKKTSFYLLFSILLIPGFAFNQITITADDFPTAIGTEYVNYEGWSEIKFDLHQTGADYVWDYEDADTLMGALLTETIIDPDESIFPNTNIFMMKTQEFLGLTSYVETHSQITDSGLSFLGYRMYDDFFQDTTTIEAQPGIGFFKFPMTYQSEWEGTYLQKVLNNGVIQDTVTTHYQCDVNGWGTIITPYGAFDCLKLTTVWSHWNDTINNWYDFDTTFTWLSNDIPMVFQVDVFETTPLGTPAGTFRIYESGNVIDPEQHPVTIDEGWSGISSYIEPINQNLNYNFGQLGDFVMAYNHVGIYYPAYNINTMGTWPVKGVFVVKNGSEETMIVEGYPDSDKTILIHDFWTLIPVVSSCAVDVEELFMAHTSDLVMVKEIAGHKVYWPEMGINMLETLEPGKAYYALASEAFSITFDDCNKFADGSGDQHIPSANYPNDDLIGLAGWNTPTLTPTHHTIALTREATGCFESGSIIGVFDQYENCFGVITVDGKVTCITAFGNDSYSDRTDGFVAGDQILYKLYKPSTNEEFWLEPEYDYTMPQCDGTFHENGISAITGFKSENTSTNDVLGMPIQIYPKPSDGTVFLSGCPAGALLVLSNAQGQTVMKTKSKNSTVQLINLGEFKPGIYLLSIQYKRNNSFHKIILR